MDWLQHFERADPRALEAPLCMLRLEKKTEVLEAAGLRSIRALLTSIASGGLYRIPSVGRTTVDDVRQRLSHLSEAVRPDDGSIDWQRYAVACGCDLVPDHEVRSGAAFLSAFPAVIETVIRCHDNPVEQLILTQRLMRQHHDRLTLDEIALRAKPRPVSRERVRQLEKRLIEGLSGALLFDDYRGLPFHFRETFSGFWKAAARRFETRAEIPFAEFMHGLEAAWGVSAGELFPHLPLITAILTSRASIPQELRRGMKLDPRLHAAINATLLTRPLVWLALRKVCDELMDDGIETVGDLVEAARAGSLPSESTRAGQLCNQVLGALAGALRADGTVNWKRYGAALGLHSAPADDRATPIDFLSNLADDLEEVARINATSGRAADIFRLRTCVPQAERLTLQQVADLLGSHGPSIKREESVLLDSLHSQLVEHDFRNSQVLFPMRFLGWWAKAWIVYQANRSSYLTFCAALAREWQIPLNLVHANADALWAVLARYPNGRRSSVRYQKRRVVREEFSGGTIVLRGFRRAH